MMCSQGIIEIYSKNYPLEKQELTRPLQIYQEFLNMVLRYYTKEHNVSFYAEKLGLTFSLFLDIHQKSDRRDSQEILTQTIIIDAKAQLKGTNREIKNIAMDLGFNNLSFFNKFFRRNVGMTPQEYRGKSYTYSVTRKHPTSRKQKRNILSKRRISRVPFIIFTFVG